MYHNPTEVLFKLEESAKWVPHHTLVFVNNDHSHIGLQLMTPNIFGAFINT